MRIKINIAISLFLAAATNFCFISNAYADPTQLPLLQQNDLIYEGAFRVPEGKLGLPSNYPYHNALSFSGNALGYNPITNSLILEGRSNILANISIPPPAISTTISSLPVAISLQTPIYPTNIPWNNLLANFAQGSAAVPGGTLVYHNRLINAAYQYYDTTAGYSHFVSSPDWSGGGGYLGTYRVGVNPVNPTVSNAPLVGGFMTIIPQEWQDSLGGPALTGMAAISIISRTSSGPCAYVFNPDDLGVKDPAPATMLVGYPSQHSTIGSYSSSTTPPYTPTPEPIYNSGVEVHGVVFPSGSRSVLFFGRYGYGTRKDGSIGAGENCYGSGTANINEIGTIPDIQAWFNANPTATGYSCGGNTIPKGSGNECCYDPITPAVKGPHMPPYVYRIWAYDAAYMLKVKRNEIIQDADLANLAAGSQAGAVYQPWNLKPYGVWDLKLPFAIPNAEILGAAYDSNTQRIFITQAGVDLRGLEPFPLIQVFKLNLPLPPPLPPELLKITPSK